MEEIIIDKNGNKILVCVLESGEIVEKYEFDSQVTTTIGNIYVGTVEEILDGMQACFVDIGLSKKAFLSLKDAMPKVNLVNNNDSNSKLNNVQNSDLNSELNNVQNSDLNSELNSDKNSDSNSDLPIVSYSQDKKEECKVSNILKRGQQVLVQIRKEAFEDKGPRVSTHITLAGNYLVLMPETDIITISQKIENNKEKERLFEIIKRELPQNFGLIVRTDAFGVSEDDILLDLKQLLEKWKNIQKAFKEAKNNEEELHLPSSKLIYNDNQIVKKIARDMVRKNTKKVYINDEKIYSGIKDCVNAEIVEFQDKKDFILEFGLQTEFERIANRKIWLKCGAQIVIDKTEALTAIDVNSSRCTGKENLEETVFKVNKEAAVEIMKQIRLKDIGGIIIIDFIDMHKTEYKNEILNLMKQEQKKDRSKIEIKDFTQLNLVEMTRKKMYV